MHLSKAPLYYGLVQAQFNHVAAMNKYIEDIQEKFRRAGYTEFATHQLQQLEITSRQDEAPVHNVTSTLHWGFLTNDRSAGFILGQSSIAFHTTNYQDSTTFMEQFLFGLEVVHDTVELAHLNRLGVRLLDAVLPRNGEEVRQYLKEGVQGLNIEGFHRYSLNELVYDLPVGESGKKPTLILRVITSRGNLGFPADLLPLGIRIQERFIETQTDMHAIIDSDCFIEDKMEIETSVLKMQLIEQLNHLNVAFLSTTSDHAIETWR